MSKKQTFVGHKSLSRVKPWYFLVIALIAAGLSVYGLRANSMHMAELRAQVFAADKSGDNVQGALQNLQAYVTHHMNTNLSTPDGVYPPIQLKYTYDRLLRAHSEQIVQHNQEGAQLYSQALTYCQPRTATAEDMTICAQNYVNAHGAKTDLHLQTIPDSLYKFDFASPLWSPDLAGWSLVATILSLLLFIFMWVWQRQARRQTS